MLLVAFQMFTECNSWFPRYVASIASGKLARALQFKTTCASIEQQPECWCNIKSLHPHPSVTGCWQLVMKQATCPHVTPHLKLWGHFSSYNSTSSQKSPQSQLISWPPNLCFCCNRLTGMPLWKEQRQVFARQSCLGEEGQINVSLYPSELGCRS